MSNPSEKPQLSFASSDIERRLGIPAGRFTQPGAILPLLLAGMLGVGFYASLLPLEGQWLWETFNNRGVVPYLIVFATCWAIMILMIKWAKISLQRRALHLPILPDDPTFVLSVGNVNEVLERLHELVDDPRNFILTNRIHISLVNLRNMGRIGDVDEMLLSQAAGDESRAESSYTVLRGLVWAIPVLGFIGTVLGLSAAIGGFGGVLADSTEIETLRPALQVVTAGLATAFETTLQALVAAVGIHMLLTMVKRSEERMLDDFQDFCQRQIVARLRIHEPRERMF